MRRTRLAIVILSLAAISGTAFGQDPTPAAKPKPYEEVIKLWKANLSEDFIKKQIENGTVVYNLGADEIIRLRDAGVPEGLINVMLATRSSEQQAVPPPPPPPPYVAQPAAPPPGMAAVANRKWEGMVRRNKGVVLFKSRWDVGVLEFKEESIRWVDSKDPSKNLLVPARQVTEQFLSCLKKAGGNECFEWGFKTKDGEYRFRDVSWQQGEDVKVMEIFDFFKAVYPSLVASSYPVEDK